LNHIANLKGKAMLLDLDWSSTRESIGSLGLWSN